MWCGCCKGVVVWCGCCKGVVVWCGCCEGFSVVAIVVWHCL